ncbi:F0F1 ATP synthase subunit B [Sulfobacillus harzensis]|uniref:ATP synthase subunit b n=1 Tax=Sulfobacillus harzensis TaxID=2729629 RepID=A0A7Y0L110_9FIRM|nr:F0F1 ATP synthase subunit B [Sulfobacillus harzensis]
MSSTSLTLGNLIAAVLQFLILLFLLRALVYKKILGAMQQRRDNIAKQVNDSENLKAEAEKLRQEAESLVSQARDEAKQMLAQARRESDEQAKKIIEQAQREASYRQKAALEEIEHERDRALASIRSQVADLVLLASSKIIERNLTQEDQNRYLDEILKDAGQLQ